MAIEILELDLTYCKLDTERMAGNLADRQIDGQAT